MSVSEIQNLLKTNPEVIKQSLETSMKLQAAIVKYVQESGKKVICDTAECNCLDDVPKDLPILSNYNGKIQYMQIQISNETADAEYVESVINRLITFENMCVHFDMITAEEIINADMI